MKVCVCVCVCARQAHKQADHVSCCCTVCSATGPRTAASPDVIQVLQNVKQLLLKAKERQLELEKNEAQLTKSAKQVHAVWI